MTDQDKLIYKTLMNDFGIDNMTLEEFIALGENFDPEEYDKQVRIDLGLEEKLNDWPSTYLLDSIYYCCNFLSLKRTMTEKTIQMNLTEEQFNIIWNAMVLSENEMVDEGDIGVFVETLNEMEDIMEQHGLEVFGDVDDD